ncbi:MAG: VWA domain-containing protein [Clostridia bacterium]|nr:VWA domain-containing protein [Clostridia bacterium]
MRRFLSLSLAIIMGILLMTPQMQVRAESQITDIVFVIDDSKSMEKNAPKQMLSKAIKDFSNGTGKNTNIGVITYGLEVVSLLNLKDVGKQQGKDDVKQFVNYKIKQNAAGSDAAVGISRAEQMLSQSKNNKIIILITDGEFELSGGKTADQSKQEIKGVIDKGYTIYTVGCNPKEEDRAYISEIASSSGGVAYFPTANENLSEIFSAIKAGTPNKTTQSTTAPAAAPETAPVQTEPAKESVQNTPQAESAQLAVKQEENASSASTISVMTLAGKLTTTQIEVSTGAKQGTIKIAHSGNLNIELINPSNLPISFKSGSAEMTQMPGYTIIKIDKPIKGNWKLNITNDTNEEIKITPSFEYKLHIKLIQNSGVIYTGVQNVYAAEITADEDLKVDLKNLSVKLYIKNSDGSTDYKDMLLRNDRYECAYTCKSTGKKEASVVVLLEDGSVKSDPIVMNVIENPDKKGGIPLWFKLILLGVVLLIIFARVFRSRKKIKARLGMRKMKGMFKIELKTRNIMQPIFYRDLSGSGKKKSLYEIIQYRALLELQEIDVVGVENGIKIINNGSCRIRFTHVSSDPEGVILRAGHGFKILMSDNSTEIFITYLDPVSESENETITAAASNA